MDDLTGRLKSERFRVLTHSVKEFSVVREKERNREKKRDLDRHRDRWMNRQIDDNQDKETSRD